MGDVWKYTSAHCLLLLCSPYSRATAVTQCCLAPVGIYWSGLFALWNNFSAIHKSVYTKLWPYGPCVHWAIYFMKHLPRMSNFIYAEFIPANMSSNIQYSIPAQMSKFLTFRTDLADFLDIVLGAIVDGMRDSALADGLMLASWCCTKHSHVLHRLAQLGGCNAHAAWRERDRDDMLKNIWISELAWWMKATDMQQLPSRVERRTRAQELLITDVVIQGDTGTQMKLSWKEHSLKAPEKPIPHVFSVAAQCDLHYLLSQTGQSITAWLCLAQG